MEVPRVVIGSSYRNHGVRRVDADDLDVSDDAAGMGLKGPLDLGG